MTLAIMRALDDGLGEEIIKLNRHILASQGSLVSRFDAKARPITKSFITCLYGSPEFLRLQVALFSDCRRFDEVEFIYVNNSPEHNEELYTRSQASCPPL